VFFEAMPAGKRIIVTANNAFAFDIEKTGIGILAD